MERRSRIPVRAALLSPPPAPPPRPPPLIFSFQTERRRNQSSRTSTYAKKSKSLRQTRPPIPRSTRQASRNPRRTRLAPRPNFVRLLGNIRVQSRNRPHRQIPSPIRSVMSDPYISDLVLDSRTSRSPYVRSMGPVRSHTRPRRITSPIRSVMSHSYINDLILDSRTWRSPYVRSLSPARSHTRNSSVRISTIPPVRVLIPERTSPLGSDFDAVFSRVVRDLSREVSVHQGPELQSEGIRSIYEVTLPPRIQPEAVENNQSLQEQNVLLRQEPIELQPNDNDENRENIAPEVPEESDAPPGMRRVWSMRIPFLQPELFNSTAQEILNDLTASATQEDANRYVFDESALQGLRETTREFLVEFLIQRFLSDDNFQDPAYDEE